MPEGFSLSLLSKTAACVLVPSIFLCAMVQQIWAMCMSPPLTPPGTLWTTPQIPLARRAQTFACHSCKWVGQARNSTVRHSNLFCAVDAVLVITGRLLRRVNALCRCLSRATSCCPPMSRPTTSLGMILLESMQIGKQLLHTQCLHHMLC